MLVDLEKILFEAASRSSSLIDIYSESRLSEVLSTLKVGFPIVGIAPYPELVLGSNLAVQLSRLTNSLGHFVSPDVFASEIWANVKSVCPEVDVFLGEETFINFRPSGKFRDYYINELLSCSPTDYFELFMTRLEKVIENYPVSKLNENMNQAILIRGFSVEDRPRLVDNRESLLRDLHFLSEIESDLDCLKYEQYFSEIAKELQTNFMNKGLKARSQCLYTKQSSIDRLNSLSYVFENFFVSFPFYLIESLRQGKEEIFYSELVKLSSEVQHSWGDPYIREWLLDKHTLNVNSAKACFIRNSIIWVYGLREAYLNKLMRAASVNLT